MLKSDRYSSLHLLERLLVVTRTSNARIIRDGVVVYEGKLASLKRFKDDVREVAAGYECGMTFEKFNDIKEGDIVEAFEMQKVES